MLLSGLTALAAKIASASTVAQATCGLGLAVAGITGAGAAGVLPGAVQDGVAGAVESITPFELPHAADDSAGDRSGGVRSGGDDSGGDRSADDRSGGDDSGSHGGGSDDSSRHGGRDD